MKRPGLWSGLALIFIANVLVLTGVAYNRSSEPEAVIQLTERELHLSYSTEENTGLSFRLEWHKPRLGNYEGEERPGWFDQAKLESLGFDCSTPLTDLEAQEHYRKALPRKAYVVLEYEGQGWRDLLAAEEREIQRIALQIEQGARTSKVLENARTRFELLQKTGSRLVAVDVGSDPSRLRQIYTDSHRFIVLPVEVTLQYVPQFTSRARKHRPAYLYGRISEFPWAGIYVPLAHRNLLERIRKETQQAGRTGRYGGYQEKGQEPRYSVVVNYGKRREPWIVDVQPLPEPKRDSTQNKS